VVDSVRQIYTDLGQRPYRLFSVVVRWTGGEDGRGEEELVQETELLPTPHVDVKPLSTQIQSAGEDDHGYVKISQISPRYTEQDLKALFPTALPRGNFAFLELRMDQRDGNQVRRRLTVADVPYRNAEAFQWEVKAYVQESQRTADGAFTDEPNLYPPRLREES